MHTPTCLECDFHRWPICTYCTFNKEICNIIITALLIKRCKWVFACFHICSHHILIITVIIIIVFSMFFENMKRLIEQLFGITNPLFRTCQINNSQSLLESMFPFVAHWFVECPTGHFWSLFYSHDICLHWSTTLRMHLIIHIFQVSNTLFPCLAEFYNRGADFLLNQTFKMIK